jgi:hypothetical protein
MTELPRLFRRGETATLVGLVLLGAGLICLRDAYEKRGRQAPWWRGLITPI